MNNSTFASGLIGLATLALAAAPASAGSHLWRFNELFSSADGSVQFIELKECCGASRENFISGKWIDSETTGNRYVFPGNIEGDTANRHLLLATASFAELPGAPPPDFIIDGSFFDVVQDVLRYWMYEDAVIAFGPGDLPTDGIRSLAEDLTRGVNSPTNFAGDEGSVVVSCHPADLDASGVVDFGDLLEVLGAWGPCAFCAADLDRSGAVDFADVLALLNAWGPC